MELHFNFEHSHLNITDLHESGIRSVFWLEEVVGDSDTQFFDISEPTDINPIIMAVGFTKKSMPVKYVFEREGDTLKSLYARLATKQEIKAEFCKYCGT